MSISTAVVKSSLTHSEHHQAVPAGRWYTDDELNNRIISEYNKFRDSLKKQIQEQFENNFNTAKKACEQIFFSLLADTKITCSKIHLRYTSIDTFDAIFVLPEKIYLSEKFDIAYEYASKIISDYNSKNFCISFHFMPAVRGVNKNALISDGFQLTFKK
ncbi:hypothetical protein [Foetidibacter luteolus]|uniref:hypothetical protein n=1 Tax=Foetidibacter luteolus TaxID=2608880 RepID=UPI00129A995F|nr:hypothetical protein [Foetidibacter luteolus]